MSIASLPDLASDACKHDPSIVGAVRWALAWLQKHPKVAAELLEPMFAAAVRLQVNRYRHHGRWQLKCETDRTMETIAAAGEAVMVELLDRWLLPDGRPLGDALGAELPEMAAQEQALANGHTMNAMFYSQLARIVPKGKTVREKVTNERAAAILGNLRKREEAVAG